MRLTVLSVAFPFAPLTTDPAGGAEQVLVNIDRALVRGGHESLVMAAEGSEVRGRLIPLDRPPQHLNETARRNGQEAVRRALAQTCANEAVDVVHLHGSDFYAYLPTERVPTLVTLHMPLTWYPTAALKRQRSQIWFNPVSSAQARTAWAGLDLLPPIENGVDVNTLQALAGRAKRKFALAFGRICPEKGFHHAMDASARAKIPLLLAGAVYPWPEHLQYFQQQITPRLGRACRWIGRIYGERKRRLLTAARCLLIPSLVDETSSLVAMESLAAGTPVIAFPVGALPRIVEHGVTGYIVRDIAEMAEAIGLVDRLEPEICRRVARERFDLGRSTDAYLDLYRRIAAHEIERKLPPESIQHTVAHRCPC
ncbi:MAG: glycosyltransferase [Steroidobacteraceae bacterium]